MANLLVTIFMLAAGLMAFAAPTSSQSLKSTGVVVPLYVYPGKVWDEAIDAKNAHPLVPMLIIANVDNGPGTTLDRNYVSYVEKAQKAGADVLGYVSTSYAKRAQRAVEDDMRKWYALYHTDGVFLDEMATDDSTYYETVTGYAHAHSLWLVMGNPGTNVPGNAGPNVINYYENTGYPSLTFLAEPSHLSYGKGHWSYIAGDVPFKAVQIKNTAKYVGYLYATDAKEPECYCVLPTYFAQLVATLDSLP